MKNWDRWLFLAGLVVITVNLAGHILLNIGDYTSRFDVARYQQLYEHSQFNVAASEFWGNIDDPDLYSLAGIKYLSGGDPAGINFEHQPLAKYFFGLSILLFGNAAVSQLVFGLAVMVLTYFLAATIFSSRALALMPAAILSFDLLFKEQISKVYLDLFLTLNLLIFFLLLQKSLTKEKFIPWAMFWVGVVCLSKSFLVGPVLVAAMGTFLLVCHRKKIKKYVRSFFWVGIAYFLGYAVYFFYHPPWDFLDLHIRELRLYRSYVPEYPKGETLRIIYLGLWRKWFGDFGLMTVSTWSILWPVATSNLLIAAASWLKKFNETVFLLTMWCLFWLVTISLRLVFPRHLLPALPFLYILLVYTLYNLGRGLYGRWHKR